MRPIIVPHPSLSQGLAGSACRERTLPPRQGAPERSSCYPLTQAAVARHTVQRVALSHPTSVGLGAESQQASRSTFKEQAARVSPGPSAPDGQEGGNWLGCVFSPLVCALD